MNFKNMGSDGRLPEGSGNLQLQPSLTRQSSIYSLTFEELQNTLGGLGKEFGSMNMDEFLKNVWTAEETQAMASGTAMCGLEAGDSCGMGLQRQGSLTLPRTLSQKTVDEVWRDIFRDGGNGAQVPGGSNWNPQQREPTLGEMTLEDFLVRAGVVIEDMNQSAPRPINNISNNTPFYGDLSCSNTINNNGGLALGFATPGRNNTGVMPHNTSTTNITMNTNGVRPSYTPPMQLGDGTDLANQQGTRVAGVVGISDPTGNNGVMQTVVGLGMGGVTVAAAGSPVKSNGELSSLSPVPYVFNGALGRRKGNGAVEKVVERRQRRMIKNRESAARSRARKQAYTMELEAEVAKLKDQNQELQKKQEEFMEMQKNQVLETMNQQCEPKRQCLRRTHTGPW